MIVAKSSGSSTAAGTMVAANVQHQILVLLYDKMLRYKKPEKLRDILALLWAQSDDTKQRVAALQLLS